MDNIGSARDSTVTSVSTILALKPLWLSVNEIPYDDLWEDDCLWLPMATMSAGPLPDFC